MTAICIASGPSLTVSDIEKCRVTGREVYAVNDVYKLAPWANYLYAGDGDWWDYHKGVPDFDGERWTVNDQAAAKWRLMHVPGTSDGIFHTEDKVCYGKNSGFQALNLAFLHGHRDVLLLGYDMGFEAGTKKHFFGEHPRQIDRPSQYPAWIEHFRKAAPMMEAAGLKVTNCSRETALTCFEKGDLCEFS